MKHDACATIAAFACCDRYFGAAILGHEVVLRVTRVRGRGALERVRVAAWLERLLVLYEPGLVATVVDGEPDERVEDAARRIGRSVVALDRREVAHTLGACEDSLRAITRSTLARVGADSARALRLPALDRPGPRSEAARYWQMPVLALAAALAAEAIAERAMPNTRSPSP